MNYEEKNELRRLIYKAKKVTDKIVSGCSGKERFDSYSIARIAALRCKRRHDAKMVVYKCSHCEGFHTGQRTKFWGRKI